MIPKSIVERDKLERLSRFEGEIEKKSRKSLKIDGNLVRI